MALSLHDRLLDRMGTGIVSGRVPIGSVLLAEQIASEEGVSRPVVREAVRVLQSLGMVETIKRVGIRVLPPDGWNVYDSQLIRWRLSVGSTGGQLRSLTELRAAVEPKAAELAAQHRLEEEGEHLVGLALEMREVGRAGELQRFLELDIAFHRGILTASRNEMFAQLDLMIAEVLTARTERGLMPKRPHEDALALHLAVSEAVRSRDTGAAHSAMDRIMRRTAAEVSDAWSHLARPAILGDGAGAPPPPVLRYSVE